MMIRSLESWAKEEQLIANYIRQRSAGQAIEILEAGCGEKWDQAEYLTDVSYTLTGVDLDKEALERRKSKFGDLDEIVYGDLRTVEFAPNRFDVVFSSFLLEHIDGAEHVLENFKKWLKPNGILVLRIPDPNSVYGFASRVLPFQLHVLFLKYVMGKKDAGQPGTGPYPTVYDPVISRKGLQAFCAEHSFQLREELCDGYLHQDTTPPSPTLSKLSRLGSWLSLGQLSGTHRNLLYILEKH